MIRPIVTASKPDSGAFDPTIQPSADALPDPSMADQARA
jgi:hypothetical protein